MVRLVLCCCSRTLPSRCGLNKDIVFKSTALHVYLCSQAGSPLLNRYLLSKNVFVTPDWIDSILGFTDRAMDTADTTAFYAQLTHQQYGKQVATIFNVLRSRKVPQGPYCAIQEEQDTHRPFAHCGTGPSYCISPLHTGLPLLPTPASM